MDVPAPATAWPGVNQWSSWAFDAGSTSLTLEQFDEFVLPHLTRGRREPPLTLSLHVIFNYVLQLL
ncbi:MAG: hypothetical protein JF606_06580 [Burkholderiales bacterium]|jgi:hypothetical protein|nr:hypothetical protein [Burkholderiales bacterium]